MGYVTDMANVTRRSNESRRRRWVANGLCGPGGAVTIEDLLSSNPLPADATPAELAKWAATARASAALYGKLAEALASASRARGGARCGWETCNNPLPDGRIDRQYCSNACRQRAYRAEMRLNS